MISEYSNVMILMLISYTIYLDKSRSELTLDIAKLMAPPG